MSNDYCCTDPFNFEYFYDGELHHCHRGDACIGLGPTATLAMPFVCLLHKFCYCTHCGKAIKNPATHVQPIPKDKE
jgi:hypothetical protein